MSDVHLTLSLVPHTFAICRLDRATPVPDWAFNDTFFSITATPEELSVVCKQEAVPDGVRADSGWRVLKLEGPFDLTLTGILVSVLMPLGDARVNIFAISTYDTDYVMVKAGRLEEAVAVLSRAGHNIVR